MPLTAIQDLIYFGTPALLVLVVIYLHFIWTQSKVNGAELRRMRELAEAKAEQDGLFEPVSHQHSGRR